MRYLGDWVEIVAENGEKTRLRIMNWNDREKELSGYDESRENVTFKYDEIRSMQKVK